MKNLKTLAILGLALSFPFLQSCIKQEEENERPVVILKGKTRDWCWMPGPYVDPGYTATDAEDGDLTADVYKSVEYEYTAGINSGTYYFVEDSEGEVSDGVQRIVMMFEMSGIYGADKTCNSGNSDYYDTLTFYGHDSIRFAYFDLTQDMNVLALLSSDTTLTIPQQTIGSNTYEGTGTIEFTEFGSSNLIDIVIDYTVNNGSTTESCTYTLGKSGM